MKSMKAEAVRRMVKLDLCRNAIKEFRKDQKLNLSEPVRLGGEITGKTYGMLCWLNEKQIWIVGKWQEESGNLVYHVIHSFTEFGEILDCLYVSQYPEEWEQDQKDIDEGMICVHSINVTYPDDSESGYIGFEKAAGGLVRTW